MRRVFRPASDALKRCLAAVALLCLPSWIERTPEGGEVRVRRIRADGRRDKSVTIAPAGTARSSGFPQMARTKNTIVFSWTGPAGVRTAEMPLGDR
jgi:hypothetical protein